MSSRRVLLRPQRAEPLTPERLRREISGFRREVLEVEGTRLLWACYAVAEYFLGLEWVRLYVLPGAKRHSYLTMVPELQPNGMGVDKDHTIRMLNFAEMLLNLQQTEGFGDCVDRLLGGQIEPTIAELQAGMMLKRQGIPFRYVVASGVLTQDFDIEILYAPGLTACLDVKCKIEGEDYRPETILKSLKSARTKLPPDRPGLVFVKVPMAWVNPEAGTVSLNDDIETIVSRFFGNTARVVSVVFYAVLLAETPLGTHIAHAATERVNLAARFQREGSWEFFSEAPAAPDWIELKELIKSVQPR